MTIVTYLACGLRTKGPTTLAITLKDGKTSPTPDLLVTTNNIGQASIEWGNGMWTVKLVEGAHILRLEGPAYTHEEWPGVDIDTKDTPPVWMTARSETDVHLWTATLVGSDPKDPWPPPKGSSTTTIDDRAWFDATFTTLRKSIQRPRGGAL